MRYFYIITFDSQIFELAYSEEKLNLAMRAWKNGELLVMKELGGGIHANSISKILNEDLYDSYTFNVKPKMFIKDGTWYDGAERKIIRREKWKQEEMDRVLKIENTEKRMTEAETKEMLDKYKPEFLKNKRKPLKPREIPSIGDLMAKNFNTK